MPKKITNDIIKLMHTFKNNGDTYKQIKNKLLDEYDYKVSEKTIKKYIEQKNESSEWIETEEQKENIEIQKKETSSESHESHETSEINELIWEKKENWILEDVNNWLISEKINIPLKKKINYEIHEEKNNMNISTVKNNIRDTYKVNNLNLWADE